MQTLRSFVVNFFQAYSLSLKICSSVLFISYLQALRLQRRDIGGGRRLSC